MTPKSPRRSKIRKLAYAGATLAVLGAAATYFGSKLPATRSEPINLAEIEGDPLVDGSYTQVLLLDWQYTLGEKLLGERNIFDTDFWDVAVISKPPIEGSCPTIREAYRKGHQPLETYVREDFFQNKDLMNRLHREIPAICENFSRIPFLHNLRDQMVPQEYKNVKVMTPKQEKVTFGNYNLLFPKNLD